MVLHRRLRARGFFQHFDGAGLQCLEGFGGPGTGQRTQNDDGHRPVLHEALEKRKTVHARHFDVEGKHIGIQKQNLVPRDIRVNRGADDLNIWAP